MHNNKSSLHSSLRGVAAALTAGLGTSYATGFVLGKLAEEILDHQVHQFDKKISTGIRDKSSPALSVVMRLASAAGEPQTLYPVTGLVVVRWLTQKREADVATLVLALTGSASLNELIKASVERPRPRFMLHRQSSSGSGFPSSHSTMSLATYGAIALLHIRYLRGRKREKAKLPTTRRIWIPVLLLCALIGGSRVYMGVHNPSDTLGGWAAGGIWLAACGAARSRMDK